MNVQDGIYQLIQSPGLHLDLVGVKMFFVHTQVFLFLALDHGGVPWNDHLHALVKLLVTSGLFTDRTQVSFSFSFRCWCWWWRRRGVVGLLILRLHLD